MVKINVYYKIMIESQKKRENREIKEILHKSPSKRSCANGINNLLRRADARESADIIYVTHIASLRARHSYSRQKVGRAPI